MQKETDSESSVRTDDEIMDENSISEQIQFHKSSADIIDHTCDDNGINLHNIEEEADVTLIHYINATNDRSMNNNDQFIHNYYSPFVLSNNHEDLSSISEYYPEIQTVCCNKNIILELLLKK